MYHPDMTDVRYHTLVESRTEPQYPSAVLIVRSVMAVSIAERKAVCACVRDVDNGGLDWQNKSDQNSKRANQSTQSTAHTIIIQINYLPTNIHTPVGKLARPEGGTLLEGEENPPDGRSEGRGHSGGGPAGDKIPL